MRKQVNLLLTSHLEMLQEVAFKSLTGIRVIEIFELRQILNQDAHKYLNLIKLKYMVYLGLLNLEYEISEEVEHILFSYTHYLISEIHLENMNSNDKISFI